MTVKELKERLKDFDDTLEIFINPEHKGPYAIYTIRLQNNPEDYPDDFRMPAEWIDIIG